ncbi:MAG: dihydropteroate synthase [Kordiimonas sp.]
MPVGLVFGDDRAVPLSGTGLMFSGFRVLARDDRGLLLDVKATVTEVKEALSGLNREIAEQILAQLSGLAANRLTTPMPNIETPLHYTRRLVMGVLNVTPDSFSDGGKYLDPRYAWAKAERMIAEGADIIDIGGESTRPGADPVWEGEEAERVVPVIEALQTSGIPLSIDTRHSFVMDKALTAGAHIINDVTALTYDPESMTIAAKSKAPVILMHSQGEPKTMQDNPKYKNTLLDVYDYLAERIAVCVENGVEKSRLILDPGIGFGKRMVQDNLALINGLPLFHTLGCPILFGASRKSFIGAISGEDDPSKRLPGSLAAAMRAVELGAQIVRVHDVAETKQALSMVQAFRDAAMMDVSE